MQSSNFTLISLQLFNRKFLKNLNINFIDTLEKSNEPYTSLIIGPNGTGKSQILRIIIEIFRELENHTQNEKEYTPISYKYAISYRIGTDEFTFTNNKEFNLEKYNNSDSVFYKNGKSSDIYDIILPKSIIANSFILNDKFPFPSSNYSGIYHYMGLRSGSSRAGTKTFIKKTISSITDSLEKAEFLNNFKRILNFLEYDENLSIYYSPKQRLKIFTGELEVSNFREYFSEWKKSSGDFEPFALYNYKKLNIENDEEVAFNIVNFINTLSSRLVKHGRAYYLEYNIIQNSLLKDDIQYLSILNSLDLISYPWLSLKKKGKETFDIDESSSGEYHMITSLLGILSKIEDSSLILIDEPETSLHPNWQMKYVNFLKEIFKEYKGCHFIIASHSHFLVSDLKGESSSVIALSKEEERNEIKPELINKDTYGWSAEEVLYNVFRVKTTRNLYLEAELRELLHKIAIKSDQFDRMNVILNNLKKLKFSKDDPMNLIINKAEEYLSR